MSTPEVRFEGVWKKFRKGELHDSLRDLIPAIARRVSGGKRRADEMEPDDFWALKDVSFRVEPGEALGIIGSNGAGKSTVLKLLNRILRPNRGSITVRGRVGALIEVAAGFHPDLTGRENVFLQGAIMGMRRAEIERKFNDIVDFSGISDFIDTPVKRYSSGMNARLGFSIAVHLEPDVLIIDEVLSVGDFAFQRKAFARLRVAVESGIPVVIVSHQLERVVSLCSRAILLQAGQILHSGSPSECVARYTSGEASQQPIHNESPYVIGEVKLPEGSSVRCGERLRLQITVKRDPEHPIKDHGIGIRVRSSVTGEEVFATGTRALGIPIPSKGMFLLNLTLQMNVPDGVYQLEPIVWDATRRVDAFQAPSQTVQVWGQRSWGRAQLNPDLNVTSLGKTLAGGKRGATEL